MLPDTKHPTTRHQIQLFANFITCSCLSCKHRRVHLASPRVTHTANFCRQAEMRQFVKKAHLSLTYVSLRWADVAVCRSAEAMMTANIWRTGAMSAQHSRCFALQAAGQLERSGLHRRRTLLPACSPHCGPESERGGQGCAGQVAQSEEEVVCCLYPQTTATPSLSVTPPQLRWTFAASSLFPTEFHFPKVESHSPACCQLHSSSF